MGQQWAQAPGQGMQMLTLKPGVTSAQVQAAHEAAMTFERDLTAATGPLTAHERMIVTLAAPG